MERAILAGVILTGRGRGDRDEESMQELARLASSAGARVVATMVQEREACDARTILGRGKVAELMELAAQHRADLVIFDHDLTASQQRNIEEVVGIKVLDRTGVILDIFAQRARTREGRLQVELAQAEYLLPRLVGSRAELSRLGGGIGTRGPGEKKLEQDRRLVRKRMAQIREELEKVRHHRSLHRRARRQAQLPVAALVGYTNAGKSTLLYALTGAAVLREDRLFSTLDPTTRRLPLPGGDTILLSDTVGFIRHLPHQLVAAFKSTLEEVHFADLIVHVIDASRPDHESQVQVVREVLAEIGAAGRPVLEVCNKIDLLPPGEERERLRRQYPEAVLVSARDRLGLDRLRLALERGVRAAGPPPPEERRS